MTIITVALITTKWQLDLVIVNLSHLEIFRNHKFPEYCLSIYVKLCTAFTFVYKWFVLYIHIINARFSTVYYVAKKIFCFLNCLKKISCWEGARKKIICLPLATKKISCREEKSQPPPPDYQMVAPLGPSCWCLGMLHLLKRRFSTKKGEQ